MRKTSILAISDVHIGCPRLNSRLLHERFRKFVYPQITKDIDILFVCGDFFDTLITLNSLASLESVDIIEELKGICRESDCDLRVLRGTYTHDRDQPQHFVFGEDPNDKSVRLFDKIDFEFNERTGLNIVYIPDNHGSKDIYAEIRKLLDAHSVEKADILVHHGYFKHMLPPNVQEPAGCLDADVIEKYVKGCVLNGHVHLTSIYHNVISVGSFDRLAHNEESPKGFYRIDIDENGVYRFRFLENKDANKFFTFDLRTFGDMTSEAIDFFSKKWTKLIEDFRPGEQVHIRIMSEFQSLVEACHTIAKEKWETVLIDKATVVKREQIVENINMGLEELPVITPANLEELLIPIIQKKHPKATPEDIHEVIAQCESKGGK